MQQFFLFLFKLNKNTWREYGAWQECKEGGKNMAGNLSMAGKKWRDVDTWREYEGGKLTIPAAVYFFWRWSGISPSSVFV